MTAVIDDRVRPVALAQAQVSVRLTCGKDQRNGRHEL